MPEDSATRLVEDCTRLGLTIATGESLTAGLVAATLAEVPGCSAVLRGGVIAYHPDLKASLLGVPPSDLERGIVSEGVARAMARGAAARLGADIGVGTTGVAGPEPHDGEPVGSVWIAVAAPWGDRAGHLRLPGDRDAIRRDTVRACLSMLADLLAGRDHHPDGTVRE